MANFVQGDPTSTRHDFGASIVGPSSESASCARNCMVQRNCIVCATAWDADPGDLFRRRPVPLVFDVPRHAIGDSSATRHLCALPHAHPPLGVPGPCHVLHFVSYHISHPTSTLHRPPPDERLWRTRGHASWTLCESHTPRVARGPTGPAPAPVGALWTDALNASCSKNRSKIICEVVPTHRQRASPQPGPKDAKVG